MGLHLPPILASFLTIAFIFFLFRRDIREKPNVTGGLWLPLIWLFLACSRPFSWWLNFFGLPVSGAVSADEGSPVDAWFFLTLIVLGSCVLARRQVRLSEIIANNRWLFVFLLYCFISIAWSDFPFMAFKRWIKVLGHPIMALIVLTEPDPEEAMKRLMKRCAYVVVPISLLWIKYYFELGRQVGQWGGPAMNDGIAENKNMLGADLMILGFFFFWYLLETWKTERTTSRRNELWLIGGFLIGILLLFAMAHSATSFISLLIGAMTVMFVGSRLINKNFVGTYLLAALVLVAVAELGFGISGDVSEALNRGERLSGRTLLWSHLLEIHTNPILGTGFESFWAGDRPNALEGLFSGIPNEAHNGYLETYLTLGLIGLFLLIVLLVATFWKIRLQLFRNFEWGRYRLGFLVAAILYNWTEAAFRTVGAVWFVFYLIAMDYPRPQVASDGDLSAISEREEEMEVAHLSDRSWGVGY